MVANVTTARKADYSKATRLRAHRLAGETRNPVWFTFHVSTFEDSWVQSTSVDMAEGQRVELRSEDPKSPVLPLDDPSMLLRTPGQIRTDTVGLLRSPPPADWATRACC